jgi:hypothetical protein
MYEGFGGMMGRPSKQEVGWYPAQEIPTPPLRAFYATKGRLWVIIFLKLKT